MIENRDRRLAAMRARLQGIFGELCLVRDVITVSVDAMHAQVSNFDADVRRVLFQCGAERLYGQLESLSDIIEQLGGRTEFSEGSKQTRATSNQESDRVGA
jgi:hypothetical protein